ncbi:hypothetical protein BDN70DRAFT_871125 [Pholiota conissans]|uniref:Uncharacterized protein n=1 Tax=Pholiota conissans TaxID=109636 RepID=A0A9P5ZF16_9AGAR|nr:hypothetical protein BDN70DRAFT_871125 [Pholiota conissans]
MYEPPWDHHHALPTPCLRGWFAMKTWCLEIGSHRAARILRADCPNGARRRRGGANLALSRTPWPRARDSVLVLCCLLCRLRNEAKYKEFQHILWHTFRFVTLLIEPPESQAPARCSRHNATEPDGFKLLGVDAIPWAFAPLETPFRRVAT